MLKEDRNEECFTDGPIQRGVCEARFCDIAVFVLNGMLIVRIYFQKDFFAGIIRKINSFYKKCFITESFD